MRERVHGAGAQLRPPAGWSSARGRRAPGSGRTRPLGALLGAGREAVDAGHLGAREGRRDRGDARARRPRRSPSRCRSPGRRRARRSPARSTAVEDLRRRVGNAARRHLVHRGGRRDQRARPRASARGVESSSNSPTPARRACSRPFSSVPSPNRTVRSASRQVKDGAVAAQLRGGDSRVGDRPQPRLDLVAQVLVVGRQRELLAQMLERLVDGEAGAERGDLEQHPARLAEVDRAEVEAVDHRGRRGAALDHASRARPRARRSRGPGDVVDAAGALEAGLGRRLVVGPEARRAARRAPPSRRRRGRIPIVVRARSRAPPRAASGLPRGPGCRRGRRESPAAPARPGPRDGRRSAARRRPRPPPARAPSPSGSEKCRRPSWRSDSVPLADRRSSQKSIESSEPTRQTIWWIIPAPARPPGTPGYSKKVRSEPGSPFSSA